jgi:predicted DsbA family dithiol-disulfide isomerase
LQSYDGDVEVVWRSYELDPGMPATIDKPLDQVLSQKYGVSIDRAREMQKRVSDVAQESGLCMNFDSAKTGNTFDAHRLIKFAQTNDLGGAMKERLMSAYFVEGIAISDRPSLVELAVDIGLNEDEARDVLESGAYGETVRTEEAVAMELGIRGVPFFLIDGEIAVSGAQSAEVMLSAIASR